MLQAPLTFILVLVLLLAVAKALRTYRRELRACFQPRRGPIPRPSALGTSYDVSFVSADGVLLSGWYAPSSNGAAVVMVHGSPGSRLDLVDEAKALIDAGYGVLLFDMPGHGESGGRVTWGKLDQGAVRAALDFVARAPRVDASRIGLFGFSLGASVAARVAVTCDRVRAVILSGAFETVEDQVGVQFAAWGPITRLPAIAARRAGGMALDELRAGEAIASLAKPVLFVAGDQDPIVPLSLTRALHKKARNGTQLLVVRGAAHGAYASADGLAYAASVQSFFSQTLAPVAGSRKRNADDVALEPFVGVDPHQTIPSSDQPRESTRKGAFVAMQSAITILAAVIAALSSAACTSAGTFVWAHDLPARRATTREEYRVHVGDVISVHVFGQDAMAAKGRVRSDGRIAVPMIGDVDVRNKRPAEVSTEIEARMKTYVVAPHVTVTVDESRPLEVSVIGEVQKPGVFVLDPSAGIAQALASAQGTTEAADRGRIFVVRNEPTPMRIRFTYEEVTRGAAPFSFQPGDLVVVE